jgi:hypothetical protein
MHELILKNNFTGRKHFARNSALFCFNCRLRRHVQTDGLYRAIHGAEATGNTKFRLFKCGVLMLILSIALQFKAMDRASLDAYPAGNTFWDINDGFRPLGKFMYMPAGNFP